LPREIYAIPILRKAGFRRRLLCTHLYGLMAQACCDIVQYQYQRSSYQLIWRAGRRAWQMAHRPLHAKLVVW